MNILRATILALLLLVAPWLPACAGGGPTWTAQYSTCGKMTCPDGYKPETESGIGENCDPQWTQTLGNASRTLYLIPGTCKVTK